MPQDIHSARDRLHAHWQFLSKMVDKVVHSNNLGLTVSMADTLETAVSEWQDPSERPPVRGSVEGTLTAPVLATAQAQFPPDIMQSILEYVRVNHPDYTPPPFMQAIADTIAHPKSILRSLTPEQLEAATDDPYESLPPIEITDNIIDDAIQGSISGIISRYRADFRAAGVVNDTLSVKVPLRLIQQRAQSRIDGLHSDQVILTIAHLRERLGKMGVSSTTDTATLDVQVPPPRSAHAR